MTDDYKIREEDIDEMHNLDLKQKIHLKLVCLYCDCDMLENPEMQGVYYCPNCEESILLKFELNASSAGRKQTGAAPISPPIRCDSGSRLPKKQKGSHFDMPSKSESNPSVSPYPPVKYTWEIE